MNNFGYGGTNGHILLESPSDTLQRVCTTAFGVKSLFTDGILTPISPSQNGQSYFTAKGSDGFSAIHEAKQSRSHVEISAPTKYSDQALTSSSMPVSSQFGVVEAKLANGSHVVQESGDVSSTNEPKPFLFPLTAFSEPALDATATNLLHWLTVKNRSHTDLEDLSYTLSCRRSKFAWRSVIVASSAEDLKAELALFAKVKATPSQSLAFVFTGQGAQWFGMGRELLTVSRFTSSILKSDMMMKALGADWSLLEELDRSEPESKVGQSHISQPATTAIQIALVDLLTSFGVSPSSVIGHSSGEIAAAYAAGALNHRSAIEM